MRIYRKVVSLKNWQILEKMNKKNVLKNFYLAAGTGCALILGHRYSRDFDFFSKEEFDPQEILIHLKDLNIEVENKSKYTLLLFINDTPFSFFYYPYKLLNSLIKYRGLKIASLIDIGCMKLDAIATRGKKRDFIDLYFISKKLSLKKLLSFYLKKYDLFKNNIFHLLKSLLYFEDAENDPMPKMIKKIDWEEIKKYFEREVKKITSEYIK